MQISKYIATLLLCALSLGAAARGVKSIELPRGELSPFGGKSLFVSQIDKWQRAESCDTLFHAKYIFPIEWLNREVLLRVEYVDAPYQIEINGEVVTECRNGNTPTEFNLTRESLEGGNEIALRLSPSSPLRALEGWRESNSLCENPIRGARVSAHAKLSVRDITATTNDEEGNLNTRSAIILKNYNLGERNSMVRYRLSNSNGVLIANGLDSMSLRLRGEDTLYFTYITPLDFTWSDTNPTLNSLDVELLHEGRLMEHHTVKLGFRHLSTDKDGVLSVNGEPKRLKLSQVESTITRSEIKGLKSRGINTILFPAGAHPTEALEACDELGVYVILTAPINSSRSGDDIKVGGNTTNSKEWLPEYVTRLESAFYAAQRHPSLIAFNLATKSLNGYNLYEGYTIMKSIAGDLPIVNLDGGGEWNGDKLTFEQVR